MAEPSAQLISIVLPVCNQADHIRAIVEGYQQALQQLPNPCEVLLVVNNSQDASLQICQELAESAPSLRVLHSAAGGWGRAVKLGLSQATGEWLCYTNSARTTAEELCLVLQQALKHPHTVFKATRRVRDDWRRRLGSLLYNVECRTLFRLATWDVNATPKVFPRRHENLLKLTQDDDLIDLEFNLVCRQCNYPVVEVPIYASRRHGGASSTNYRSAAQMYLGAWRLWRHSPPSAKH